MTPETEDEQQRNPHVPAAQSTADHISKEIVYTIQLARAVNFPPLLVIPCYFIYLAFAGWLVVSLGFIYSLLSRKSRTTV